MLQHTESVCWSLSQFAQNLANCSKLQKTIANFDSPGSTMDEIVESIKLKQKARGDIQIRPKVKGHNYIIMTTTLPHNLDNKTGNWSNVHSKAIAKIPNRWLLRF